MLIPSLTEGFGEIPLKWRASLKTGDNESTCVDEPLICLEGTKEIVGWCCSVGWDAVVDKLMPWCWVPLSDVAAAMAAANENCVESQLQAAQLARDEVKTLASSYGCNFVWSPRFAIVHDTLATGANLMYPPGIETKINMGGYTFSGPEQYLQAMRSFGTPDHTEARKALAEVPSVDAMKVGRRFSVSPYWSSERKIELMRGALRAKFLQHRDIFELLADTAGYPLVYARKGEALFGVGKSFSGKNVLGTLLAELRDGEFSTMRTVENECAMALEAERSITGTNGPSEAASTERQIVDASTDETDLPESFRRCIREARQRLGSAESKGEEQIGAHSSIVSSTFSAVLFGAPLPTASSAAAELGVSTAQIVNSLIFELKPTGGGERRPILVCSPGNRRVDTKKLALKVGVSKNKVWKC